MRKLLAILFILGIQPGFSQVLKIGEAKFKTGDNPAWSQAGFDDSQWVTLKTNLIWEEQGFSEYNGYAWYRIHVRIPSSLKTQSFWKDTLRIYLAKIDDADEVYLNGVLIGKKGSLPFQSSVYVSAWDTEREYHVSTGLPAIKWDADNILAVRVYDGGGGGGLFGGIPSISMMDLVDGIKQIGRAHV